MCNRDIDHRVEDQQENFYGLLNSQDDGKRPRHLDRNIDDHHELQLRKLRSFLQSEPQTTGGDFSTS